MKQIAIIGVGNYLMGDEGVGIHAVKALERMDLHHDAEVIDAGVPSLSLLHMMTDRRLVIIIDCADFSGKSGEIKTFTPDMIKLPDSNRDVSLHASDLLSTLKLADAAGLNMPEVWIVGVQPDNISMTTSLSEKVSGSISLIPKIVEELIRKYSSSSLH